MPHEHVSLLDPGEIHHLKNVLRLKRGAPLILFNGKGQEATGTIAHIRRHSVDIRIGSLTHAPPRTLCLTLACAVPKRSKFELIVEKCTELGVDEIIPMITRRTQIRCPQERVHKKLERYHKVAVNAAKQAQRPTVPHIRGVTAFSEVLLNIQKTDQAFLAHLGEKQKCMSDYFSGKPVPSGRIIFLIGPEGDFTPDEIREASRAGCRPVSLGQTVLRVETAAMAVVASMRIAWNAA